MYQPATIQIWLLVISGFSQNKNCCQNAKDKIKDNPTRLMVIPEANFLDYSEKWNGYSEVFLWKVVSIAKH